MAAVLCCHAAAAHAASDWCGVVLSTKDGFLNIRSGPGPEFPIIHQVTAGSILQGNTASGEPRYTARGEPLLPQWATVHQAHGASKVETKTGIDGYVNTRFVQEIDCNLLAGN